MSSFFEIAVEELACSFLPSEESNTHLLESGKIGAKKASFFQKIQHYALNFFKGSFALASIPLAGSFSLLESLKERVIEFFSAKKLEKTSTLSEEELGKILNGNIKEYGFSDSFFQSCGLGTAFSQPSFEGRSDWAQWVADPKDHINGSVESIQNSFRNYLEEPDSLIRILKELGVTAYRFSLERSVIQPKAGEYDAKAIEKYQNFCKALKQAGIEPWVTLNHFVVPDWFAQAGGFDSETNIASFVSYCEKMVSLFKESVTNWMTFNELCVDVFQHKIRQVYPTSGGGVFSFFDTMRNMFVAHCEIYKRVKKLDPKIRVGITHQWLKFVPSNSWNPFERIGCYFLSLFTHDFVYNFFKTGALRVPFVMNAQLWEGEKPPVDFLGVQSYGFPVLKMGLGSGDEPGTVKKWEIPFLNQCFVAGVTCKEKGGKVSSFGPPYQPEDLEEALKEAEKLHVPIAITETGSDARFQAWGEKETKLDEKTQKEYFQKIFSILTRFKVSGLFVWTLFRNQLEWENGVEKICLGLVQDVKKEKSGIVRQWKLSPAAEYLKAVFEKMRKAKLEESLS
jgi:beta-glucosidase